MTRIVTKIGDVFEVKLNENVKKCFQYIANDSTQLNSDVIRAFKKTYSINTNPDLLEIVNDEVDFYSHCSVKLGIKMNVWKKMGASNDIGDVTNIFFRGTKDYGIKKGENPIKISHNWHVWKINDKDFTKIENLTNEYKQFDIGLVVNPNGIIELLKGNKYPPLYPDFE